MEREDIDVAADESPAQTTGVGGDGGDLELLSSGEVVG